MKRVLIILFAALFPFAGTYAQLGMNAEQLEYRVISTGVEPSVAVTLPLEGRSYEGNIIVPPYVKIGGVIYAVSAIDTAAFAGSPYLASVQLPQTLEKMGSRAFADCPRLVSVQFSSGPRVIESQAFTHCERLQRVSLPYKCEVLDPEVFYFCHNLEFITLPSTLKRIGARCFAVCSKLEEIRWHEVKLRFVDESAFEGCTSLKNRPMVLADVPTVVQHTAKDSLESIVAVAPTTEKQETWEQREASFEARQKALTDQVQKAKQTTATVGGDVSELVDPSRYDFTVFFQDNIFYISVMSNNQVALVSALPHTSEFQSKQDMHYAGDITLPEQVEYGGNRYTVTLVADRCFANCRDLQSVVLPPTIKDIGDNAFLNCVSLRKVEIPSSIERVSETAFAGCTVLEYRQYDNALYLGNPSNPYQVLVKSTNVDISSIDVYITTSLIADGAFFNCRKLNSFKSPLSMRYIGAMAFGNCVNLSKVHITEPTTVIRPSAFAHCDKLTKMNIAGVRTSLGEYEW